MFMHKRTREQLLKRNSLEEKRFMDKLRTISFEEKAFEKSHSLKVNQNISMMESSEENKLLAVVPEEICLDGAENLKMEQSIKQLLLTNGEVDIEKVLCLHLLAIKQSDSCVSRDDYPRRINIFTRYSNLLPNYIIESGDSKIKCICWERKSVKMKCDSRPIRIHLTINKQIEKIINIVIITLKELNEKKLKLLISMAHDINVLRTILVRPCNQNYLTELLKSNLVLNSPESDTECCTLMKGSNEMIRDVNKYKKNMVFRLNPPNSLVYLQALLTENDKSSSCPDINNRDSFCSLIDVCRKISVGEDIDLTGFAILRNNSVNSSGTAVISEDGNDITYIPGPKYKKTNTPLFENNLTLLLKSTGLLDKKPDDVPSKKEERCTNHMTRMSERKIKSLEEIARKAIDKMKWTLMNRKAKREPPDPEVLRGNILKRLSNQQRILLAQESTRLKSKKGCLKNEEAPLAEIMSNVMSKRSMLNLAIKSTKEERDYFLKPIQKGGLGIGEIIIGKSNMTKMEKIAAIAHGEVNITMITPLSEQVQPAPEKSSSIDVTTDNSWDLLKIKHDISQAEISKKFSRFLNHHTQRDKKASKAKKRDASPKGPTLTVVETRLLGRIRNQNPPEPKKQQATLQPNKPKNQPISKKINY